MSSTVSFGHLRSFGHLGSSRVSLHWSLIPFAAVLWWLLAFSLLPGEVPGGPPVQYWLVALSMALAFVASLLGHELAHAAVARRRQVAVRGIVLWLLGGVAELDRDPATAGDEVAIVAAGPLASLALAAGCGLLVAELARAGAPQVLVTAAIWLARANLALAVLNLVPAFPLDGGRLLRALLWHWKGDRTWATVVSARLGQALGLVVAGAGLLVWLRLGLAGLWLVVVGSFIVASARPELRALAPLHALAELRVGQVMTPAPLAAPAHATVQELMDRWPAMPTFSALPLVDVTGRIQGLVGVGRLCQVPPPYRPVTLASAVALGADDVVVCGPHDLLRDVALRMRGSAYRRAVVVHDGHLVGILAPSDLADAHHRAAAGAPPPSTAPAPASAPA